MKRADLISNLKAKSELDLTDVPRFLALVCPYTPRRRKYSLSERSEALASAGRSLSGLKRVFVTEDEQYITNFGDVLFIIRQTSAAMPRPLEKFYAISFGDLVRASRDETRAPDTNAATRTNSPSALKSGIKMSGSDNQNISGRDYNEGDEVGNESYTPSTGGSTFDQIDEVEHVSVGTEENEGSLITPTLAEEAGTSEQIEMSSRREALLAPGEASSSAPNPTETTPTGAEPKTPQKKMVFLNSEGVRQQECLLTHAKVLESEKGVSKEPEVDS
nr:hypothetical protein Iba_chr12cCG10760 [Ipomoea batatas]